MDYERVLRAKLKAWYMPRLRPDELWFDSEVFHCRVGRQRQREGWKAIVYHHGRRHHERLDIISQDEALVWCSETMDQLAEHQSAA